jgi:hypothetical protein
MAVGVNQELFERNVEVFRKHAMGLIPQLPLDRELASELVEDGNGGYDIAFRGARLYGKNLSDVAEEQLNDFRRQPKRLNIFPPQSANLDRIGADFVTKILHDSTEAGIEFLKTPNHNRCYSLIVFGIGLGPHIFPLIEETKCRNLVLVEPNPEFIVHSFRVFDWGKLFDRFLEKGMHIAIIIDSDGDRMAHVIRTHCRSINPSVADGITAFCHFPNAPMEKALVGLFTKAELFITGLGYLDDEMDMILNSHGNLKVPGSKIFYIKDRELPSFKRNLPAFVIASGPSLDDNIEVIKANKDKALIISCGSALSALLPNGITPDFHVEMECVPMVADIMEQISKKYDFSNITLVAADVVDPRVKKFFKKNILFFRNGLGTYLIFSLGIDYSVRNVTPTVSNLGVGFAIDIGCRDIYFFGIDLGSKRPDEEHHSRHTIYVQQEREGLGADGKKFKSDWEMETPVPGNFGGDVYTGRTFIWGRDSIEAAINQSRSGRTYYNCSDGVRIEGTIPKAGRGIKLPPPPISKAEEVHEIVKDFPEYTAEHFKAAWLDKDWPAIINTFVEKLSSFCDEHNEDRPEEYLDRIIEMVMIPDPEFDAVPILFRGSILLSFAGAYYYFRRVSQPEKFEQFDQFVRDEVKFTLRRMGDELITFIKGLDNNPDR